MSVDAPRRPGLSLRVRLTLTYAAFLTVAGAAMFVVLLLVLRYLPDTNLVDGDNGTFAPNRSDLLDVAVPLAAYGMGFLVLVGLVGGWLLAGRILRPLVAIDQAVRLAATGALDHRIDMPGPNDELRRLADGLDDMLGRLQRSFDEQRRFTANASHELRTPLAVTKTMLEVATADPGGQDLDQLFDRLGEVNDRSILILDALLRLARADSVPLHLAPCALDELVGEVVDEITQDGTRDIESSLELASVPADRSLLLQLIQNLLDNAMIHQPDGGRVWVRTFVDREGRASLLVENTGPVMAPELVSTLDEPFVRGAERTRGRAGSGLGLALVASVARAHRAELALSPRDGGGLVAIVRFDAKAMAPTS